MKKLLKLMIVITFGILLFSSCQEGGTSMPDMLSSANKNMQMTDDGDPMIPFLDPALFNSGFSLDVISDDEVASVEIFVEFYRIGSGFRDTASFVNQTTFPVTYSLNLQSIADLFPDSSSVILNDLNGGDYFRFYTGNIFMADGREILEEYSFDIQSVSETTGNDTIIELNPTGHSPALQNINATNWLQEYTYFVGCPTDLAGTYDALSSGTNTDSQLPNPAVDIYDEVTITHNGGLSYTIDRGFCGMYELWYCAAYGYCWDNAQNFLDICGELQGNFADSWGQVYPIDGSVDETTGVITYHYFNAWGDEITSVLTPQ